MRNKFSELILSRCSLPWWTSTRVHCEVCERHKVQSQRHWDSNPQLLDQWSDTLPLDQLSSGVRVMGFGLWPQIININTYVKFQMIDWIGVNGHYAKLWLCWATPERGEGYIGNSLSNFYMVLYCSQRIDSDTRDRPVNVPIRQTWLERSALPKETACIPQCCRHIGSNLEPPNSQSPLVSNEYPKKL